MSTLFFRDQLSLNNTLLADTGITVSGGGTIVIGARDCRLNDLPSDINYVILADTLGTDNLDANGNPAPISIELVGSSISIYANTIAAPLSVIARGATGITGRPGTKGKNGTVTPRLPTGTGSIGPGGNGGPGGPGGAGGNGGNITIRYATAASVPIASAPPGMGGKGGPGGAGGVGNPPGKAGAQGPAGPPGKPGTVNITQVSAGEVFTGLEADWLSGWSAYRTDVGEYLFRLFDFASQLQAQTEFSAALELNPANTQASTLLTRLVQQETPSGIARDLDMAPDYKDISVGLLGETQLVLSEYLELQGTETQDLIAQATLDQFNLVLKQLKDRLTEAQSDVTVANAGVQVANANFASYGTQITNLQEQITSLKTQPLSLDTILTTVGSVAGAIAGIITGGGAIVAIPSAIAALSNPLAGIEKYITLVTTGSAPKGIGGDLTDLLNGTSGLLTNFDKIYDELNGSSNDAAITQLAQQITTLTLQEMVASLRIQQANDTLAAAQQRVTDYTAEVNTATNLVNEWSQDVTFLDNAVNEMINVARDLSGMVADDIFIARRALEIYQLEDASSVHFDYGWLHPDEDNDLMSNPLKRAQACLQSVQSLPQDVITWNDIFVSLNESLTTGFDIVHPDIEVTIDEPEALASLESGGGIRFSIGIGPDPASAINENGIYELKVNNLSLELTGASESSAAQLWIQHTGHWILQQPPAGSPPVSQDVEFTLFPHVEIFNLKAASGSLTAQIPEQPQSSADPGPPFSFWGRGVLADWYLYTDSSISSLDLSGLSAVKLTIGCIGLVAQGAATPAPIRVRPTPVPTGVLVTTAK